MRSSLSRLVCMTAFAGVVFVLGGQFAQTEAGGKKLQFIDPNGSILAQSLDGLCSRPIVGVKNIPQPHYHGLGQPCFHHFTWPESSSNSCLGMNL